MNKLNRAERAKIIRAMVEGNSLRSITRITGRSINTVSKLLVDLGEACNAYQDRVLRDLPCKTLQADEIWSFVYAREKNVPEDKRGVFGYGDVWTFTAIDADTRLIASWMCGPRDPFTARLFLEDLRSRLAHRVQLTTDGHKMYVNAVADTFGETIDFAQLVKIYETPRDQYGHATGSREVVGTIDKIITGSPDEGKINTSYVERQNLTMRMGMRRFTRSTNGHSKKVENHAASIAIHFMYVNFAKPMKVLADPYPLEEIADLLD